MHLNRSESLVQMSKSEHLERLPDIFETLHVEGLVHNYCNYI